jgi:hypothetical protein
MAYRLGKSLGTSRTDKELLSLNSFAYCSMSYKYASFGAEPSSRTAVPLTVLLAKRSGRRRATVKAARSAPAGSLAQRLADPAFPHHAPLRTASGPFDRDLLWLSSTSSRRERPFVVIAPAH